MLASFQALCIYRFLDGEPIILGTNSACHGHGVSLRSPRSSKRCNHPESHFNGHRQMRHASMKLSAFARRSTWLAQSECRMQRDALTRDDAGLLLQRLNIAALATRCKKEPARWRAFGFCLVPAPRVELGTY
jgi:hypothetical protein